jgi:hypothetical protein
MAKLKNLKVGIRVEPKWSDYGPGTIISMPPESRYIVVRHDNGMEDMSSEEGAGWTADSLRLIDTPDPEFDGDLYEIQVVNPETSQFETIHTTNFTVRVISNQYEKKTVFETDDPEYNG